MDCKIFLHKAEFSATVLVSGGLDMAGEHVVSAPSSNLVRHVPSRITISAECAYALRDFLVKIMPNYSRDEQEEAFQAGYTAGYNDHHEGSNELDTGQAAYAFKMWFKTMFPTSVDEVGQRPAAETAAEVTPQQATSAQEKAAVSVT
jgi:hypothetical protein